MVRKFEVRQDIMDAQNAYVAKGMEGPSPDRDMWLIPEKLREDLRTGFTVNFGYPGRDDMSELVDAQRAELRALGIGTESGRGN